MLEKYKTKGLDYHYQQINKSSLFNFNAFLLARYQNHIDLIIKNIKKHFKKTKTLEILDLGCGDGVLLYLLKQQLKNYRINLHGLDLSERALSIARNKIPG